MVKKLWKELTKMKTHITLIKHKEQTSNEQSLYSPSKKFIEGKTLQYMVLENIKKIGNSTTHHLSDLKNTKKNIVVSRFNGANGDRNILTGIYDAEKESNIGPIKKRYILINETGAEIISLEEYNKKTNGYTHNKGAIYSQLTTSELTFLFRLAGVKSKNMIKSYKPKHGTYRTTTSIDQKTQLI